MALLSTKQEEGGDPLACLYDDGFLVEWGYKRADLFSALVAQLHMDKVQEQITMPCSQEWINALALIKTAGGFFRVTGGSHLTADEGFLGDEKKVQGEELKLLKKRFKEFQHFADQEADAKLIMEKECGNDALKVSELESLIKWKLHVKTLPKDLKLKGGKLAKWIQIKAVPTLSVLQNGHRKINPNWRSLKGVTSQLKKWSSVESNKKRKTQS
jgi:hypothetical protein